MGLFDFLKKTKNNVKEEQNPVQADSTQETANESGEYLEDITYIKAMRHVRGTWQQYDVLLAATGYGWDYMIKSADYMAQADLTNVSQVTASYLGRADNDLSASYAKHNRKCSEMPELMHEQGVLSIAGISQAVNAPMKIVWFNQTNTLRFFTLVDDDQLILKYVESVVRRNFGTKDAMKLGKPLPQK